MSKPLRWGVLGCANIARTVIPAIASVPRNIVTAVASRSLDKARAFAADFGVDRSFGSYREMLESGRIDVVYNPLPNALHAEWTIRALEAGLPVLCEKPLTATLAQALEVLAASKRTGLVVAEAFMYRHHPLYETLLDLVRSGSIGAIRSIHASFSFLLEDRSEVPASEELGGGSLRDVGCYPVTLARMVLDEEPKRAFAMARFEGVDDTLSGLLEFPGGAIAHVESSIVSQERGRAEIVGSRGAITLESPWFPGDAHSEIVLLRDKEESRIPCPGGNGYVLEVADFVRAVRSGEPPRWPVEDAVANAAAIEALLESARGGCAVEVGPGL